MTSRSIPSIKAWIRLILFLLFRSFLTSLMFVSADDVFSEVSDPAWMARLSLPLTGDYHDNVFVPNGPPSSESEQRPQDCLDSSSFSTFGKKEYAPGILSLKGLTYLTLITF